MEKLVLLCLISSMEFISNNVHAEPFFRKDYTYLEEVDSFYKVSRGRATWWVANKRCTAEGAELWVPENEMEVNAVTAFWSKIPRAISHCYIGLNDIISEGNFVTNDGRSIDEIFANWWTNQPDNMSALNTCADCADCAVMDYNKWMADENCNDKYSYICKKRHSTLDWNVLCDMPNLNYKYSSETTKCYKVHERAENWDEAHTICNAEQSYLTIINSAKERDVIVNLITDATKANGDLLHIGFHNKFANDWTTVQGTSLDSSGYTVWADHKPEQSVDLKCGAMQLSGELRGVSCDKAASFICEHDIEKLSLSVDEKHG